LITFSQITLCAVPGSTQHLNEMREMVRRCVSHPHVPEKTAFQIVIAVDEALSNAMLHSCRNNPAQKVELNIVLDEEKISVTLKNEGPYFDPTLFKKETMPDELKERKRPPLGIELIRKIFDDIQYQCRGSESDGRVNELTLIKYLTKTVVEPAPAISVECCGCGER
jgi:serine/threonine-protein kinase RsbW